jgi:hypothetical protein
MSLNDERSWLEPNVGSVSSRRTGRRLAANGDRQSAHQFGHLPLLRLATVHLDHYGHEHGGRDEMAGD